MFNSYNNINISLDVLPKEFLNYINYELSFFEKISHRKFLFNILSNDIFELKASKSKDNYKSNYQILYRTNNLYKFIKNLFMIREYLINNFGNKITTTNE
jgi:hypothetical protein